MSEESTTQATNTSTLQVGDYYQTLRTLDDDMPLIWQFAECYPQLDDPEIIEALSKMIPDGHSLDYYHGRYASAIDLFNVAVKAHNTFAGEAKKFVIYICHKIITLQGGSL